MTTKGIIGIVVGVITLLFAVILVGGSIYTIDQGERGVILRNGKIVGTSDAGLHFKTPMIEKVKTISLQTHTVKYDNVLAYSYDQQTAAMSISVSYHHPADQVESIYAQYGGSDGVVGRLLSRQVPDEVKNIFGQYTAVRAIQDRSTMVFAMQEAIGRAVEGPIVIDSVQVENIDFSDAYEESVEQRMLAEVEVQKIRQNAEREKVQAEILVIQAHATAEARVAQATAEAEATILQGNAEAEAINARGEALQNNPSIVALVQAERWDGVLPVTMVPNAAVPFLNVR